MALGSSTETIRYVRQSRDRDTDLVPFLDETMLADEREYIDAWRRRSERDDPARPLAGLAISGGGIRSATFALGVLQQLASANLLRRFDYLSTVSGGGYIGGSLTFHARPGRRRERSDPEAAKGRDGLCDAEGFPYGIGAESDSREQHAALRRLRRSGNFLTPGAGLNLIAGAAAVLRAILINLMVWLPLAASLFWLLGRKPSSLKAAIPFAAEIFGKCGEPTCFHLLLVLASLLLALNLLRIAAMSLLTWIEPDGGNLQTMRYRQRRRTEIRARYSLIAIGALFLVGTLPQVAALLGNWLSTGGGLAGIAAGAWSAIANRSEGASEDSRAPSAPLAAAMLGYGFCLLAYQLSLAATAAATAIAGSSSDSLEAAIVRTAAAAALALGFFANVNLTGLHRFYRDRLMEAYMPDADDDDLPSETANSHRLFESQRADAAASPYHLINAMVILTDSTNPRVRERDGDSFVLSPRWCGSTATGWQDSESYARQLTLPTAVAISGAAATPNTNVLRSPLVGLVASLLNLNLGYWVNRPSAEARRHPKPNHFRAARYAAGALVGRGFRARNRFLKLSDGGHFENLGVYELVRRKVKTIVVCDAVADPKFEYADFQTLRRLLRDDFGVTFAPDPLTGGLEHLVSGDAEEFGAGYPIGRRYSPRCSFAGTLHYPGDPAGEPSGRLIYVATTITRNVPWRSKAYWVAHPEFPDESTADQFFDQEQFEAYRQLGFQAAKEMLAMNVSDGSGAEISTGDLLARS